MYEIKIFDSINELRNGPIRFETEVEVQEWLEKHKAKARPFGWGLPDRWIDESLLSVEEIDLSEGSRIVDSDTNPRNEFFFPKNYRVEITDLSNDPDFIDQQAISNRVKEYPRLDEILNILMDEGTNSQAWVDMMNYRQQVKNRFPKAIR